MKSTISFSLKLAVAGVVGLGVALFAGCSTSPTALECEGFLDSFCEEIPSFQNVTVNVTGEGGGHGTVNDSSTPIGINCQITSDANGQVINGGICNGTFQDAGLGGGFSLVAAPSAGYQFGGWSGDCSGVNPVCALTFSTGPDVTFNVIARFYPLSDF